MHLSHSDAKAFTIAELLVAAGISVAIVAMLGVMFTSLTKTVSHTTASADTFRDARAAIHMMERDFSAVIAARPGAYFAVDTDSAGGGGAAIRQLEAVVAAKNQPAGNPTPAPGDACAVRYYCFWDGTARTYTLKRFFRDSKSTATVYQSLYAGGTGYVDVGNLYCSNVTTCATPATADEPLAAYVWALRVTAFDANDNIISPMNDSSGYQTTTAPYSCDPSGSSNALPAAIEISFKAMSPTAARTVIAATASQGSNAYTVWLSGETATPDPLYTRLIEPNTYVFRTRIALH